MGRFDRRVNIAGRARLGFGISGKFWVRAGQGRLGLPDLWGGPMSISTPPRRRMFSKLTSMLSRATWVQSRRMGSYAPSAWQSISGTGAGGGAWGDGMNACPAHAGGEPCLLFYAPKQPASQPDTWTARVLRTLWLVCPAPKGMAGQSEPKQGNAGQRQGKAGDLMRTFRVRTRTWPGQSVCPCVGRMARPAIMYTLHPRHPAAPSKRIKPCIARNMGAYRECQAINKG